jgi:aminocarboxymuconate-semialdehyde decarboxylase
MVQIVVHNDRGGCQVIVDVHAHYVPTGLLESLNAERRLFPSVEVQGDAGHMRMGFAGQPLTRPVAPKLADLGQRKEWLTEQGIDRQVVGGWLDIFGYELPPDEGADWCRFTNEHMLKGAAQLDSFVPLACVPLQSGRLAATVLEECLAKGFHGAMIGTQPKGISGALDDPDLNPFWEAASAAKTTIFVHPMFGCPDDRLKDFEMMNAVGRISDTTTAMARLIFSGHFDRYPGINLVIAHGGAALPYALGRLRRNHTIGAGKVADPIAAFQALYFDTVVFEAQALRYLCDVAGADKIMLGSDHPFPIGDPAPVRVVDETPLSAAERAAILGGTAARLFNIAECGCGSSHR